MKKIIIAALLGFLAIMPSTAQNYRSSNQYSYNSRSNYSHSMFGYDDVYFGFRIGPSFTTISTDEKDFDFSAKTGLNFGVVAGFGLSNSIPLFLETGLYYNEKGGKADIGRTDIKYRLNYLEVPFAFKYMYELDDEISIQPYLGAYIAYGISGKIKDYDALTSESSYKNMFHHFDAGMKIGCGMQYDMFYFELNYDLGLANIRDDEFTTCRNRALTLNLGVNF